MFDVQAFVENLIAGIKAQFQTQLEGAVKEAHDAGFAEGVASVVAPEPVDMQAQIDAAVAAAKAEMKATFIQALSDEQAVEGEAEAGLKAFVEGL